MNMIVLRSLIYAVLFYINLAMWFVAALFPAFFMSLETLLKFARGWVRTSNWLLRKVCNIKIDVRGRNNIPAGALVVASKHQSFWETFALFEHFGQPLYIYKKELGFIPIFGTLLRATRMISVDRKGGGRALIAMTKQAAAAMREGRQLIVFPEGTRRPVDAPPDYKPGFAQIYHESGVPCVPVALNSGLFWPRRDFMRYPGTLVVEFLEPVQTGLKRREFVAVIVERIEAATDRLVEEARAEQAAIFGRVPNKGGAE